MIPTFSIRPSFLGVENRSVDADYCIAGIPFDLGTTNRAGSRFGPAAIRQASRMLCDGANPTNWNDPRALSLADVGDFAIALGDITESLALIERQAASVGHLIALGGDHTITLPLLRALVRAQGPVGLVHFDAHLDTWPDNFGQPIGHGSVFRRAIEEDLIDPRRMVQIGIRSPVPRDVHDWTVAAGAWIITAEDVHANGVAANVASIREVVGRGKTYLSFDIDAIDPGQAPGTGTPEVGGLQTWQAVAIMRRLGAVNFVGMDMVEVCPPYDVSEITSLAAATMVWQYLSLMTTSSEQ